MSVWGLLLYRLIEGIFNSSHGQHISVISMPLFVISSFPKCFVSVEINFQHFIKLLSLKSSRVISTLSTVFSTLSGDEDSSQTKKTLIDMTLVRDLNNLKNDNNSNKRTTRLSHRSLFRMVKSSPQIRTIIVSGRCFGMIKL